NVIDGYSDTLSFDENGINRVKFLVNHIIGQVNANESTDRIEVENFENIKQIEKQRLNPNVQEMKEARLIINEICKITLGLNVSKCLKEALHNHLSLE
ncbi:11925_t:CDS:2, partial [Racocetra fulgida]